MSEPADTSAIIRPARPDEIEVLVEMNAEYRAAEGQHAAEGHHADGEAEIAARQRARAGFEPLLVDRTHGGVWMVLDETGAPIGYGILAWSWSVEIGGPEAVLDELYVRRRSEGFGSRALEAIVAEAWEHRMLRVFMETERANERARSLYVRHGFSIDDSIWLSRLPD